MKVEKEAGVTSQRGCRPLGAKDGQTVESHSTFSYCKEKNGFVSSMAEVQSAVYHLDL